MVCHIIMFFMIYVLLAPSGALVFILFYYIHNTYICTNLFQILTVQREHCDGVVQKKKLLVVKTAIKI